MAKVEEIWILLVLRGNERVHIEILTLQQEMRASKKFYSEYEDVCTLPLI
jgi:hypothetical protein